MADNEQKPQFLGGGPKFNRAGAQPPDTEPTLTAMAPAFRWRSLIIGLALILLVGLLYWITTGPNGLRHVGGRGGAQSGAGFSHSLPDSDSGPASTP